jgi:hypothetical protein
VNWYGHRPRDDRGLPGDVPVEPADGLPIGVQLMGPANSEPLLISLAAELEAINGWADKQPGVWWNMPTVKD